MVKNRLVIVCLLVLLLPSVLAVSKDVTLDDYELTFSYSGVVEEDDTFTLSVRLENGDDRVRDDVEFSFDDRDPFDVDGSRSWIIGSLNPGEVVSRSFRIDVDKDTAKGDYDLEFELSDSFDDYADDIEIEVLSTKADLIVGDVSSSPLIVIPDLDDVKFVVRLDNIGGGDARFVRVKLLLPDGLSASNSFSDAFSIGTIAADDSQEATFFVDTAKDLPSGVLDAELLVEYETDARSRSQRLSFDIPVKGGPQFDIVGVDLSSKLVPGGSSSLLLNLENIGAEKGEEVSVRVFENADYPFSFDEKTSFVGTVGPDGFGSAVFNVDVDADADLKSYLLKVQVRTLSRGNVLVSDFTVPVRVFSGDSSSAGSFLPLVLVLFVIGLFLFTVYLVVKR